MQKTCGAEKERPRLFAITLLAIAGKQSSGAARNIDRRSFRLIVLAEPVIDQTFERREHLGLLQAAGRHGNFCAQAG
jgi:hypothetical protein